MEVALFHEGNRVTAIHYRPELLSPEEAKAALLVERAGMPAEPEPGRGQRAELYLKEGYKVLVKEGKGWILGDDLEWRLVARPLTQEELLAELAERLDMLLSKQDQIIELLRKP